MNRISKEFSVILVICISVVLALLTLQPMIVHASGKLEQDLTFSAEPSSALQRFVSISGSDTSDCTSYASPCATINYAINQANPGDTIGVTADTYTGSNIEVVLIDKSVNLSGGWNPEFDTQIGYTSIDGQNSRRGITANNGSTITIERFNVKNGFLKSDNSNYINKYGGGILNRANLTLNNCIIEFNAVSDYGEGGGIYNENNTLTINNSIIRNNKATSILGYAGGGGISSVGDSSNLIVNSSTIHSNEASGVGGIVVYNGTIFNSVISNNTGGTGAGMRAVNIVSIQNSTITKNTGSMGSGLYVSGLTTSSVSIENTIIANNWDRTGLNRDDCFGRIVSNGHNIIGSTYGCTITATTGDQLDTDPMLGTFIPALGYHPLRPNSPAINAANPTICPAADQRGMPRTNCDIGAYEYTAPGVAASIYLIQGDQQHIGPGKTYLPLVATVVDSNGNPVPGVPVTFTAPTSGPTGTFKDSGTETITVTTDGGGTVSPILTANTINGSFSVQATSAVGSLEYPLQIETWYISATGSDSNDCKSPSTPCATFNILWRPDFTQSSVVKITNDTYNLGDQLELRIWLTTDLLGGWDPTFTERSGYTHLEGNIFVESRWSEEEIEVLIEKFEITPNYQASPQPPKAVELWEDKLTISDCYIHNNGLGIYSLSGKLTVINSTISNNYGYSQSGGGMGIDHGYANIINSTISGNGELGYSHGGGIYYTSLAEVFLLNSTITGNFAYDGAGFYDGGFGAVMVLSNSIIAGNQASTGRHDCKARYIFSYGNNLIGNMGGFCFTLDGYYWALTDLLGTSSSPIPVTSVLDTTLKMDPKTGRWHHPLIWRSPAINAGNRLAPGSATEACPATDQLGVIRPQGTYCDMGAVEYVITTNGAPTAFSKQAPETGAINQTIRPSLSWQGSTGAYLYEYCYDTTNDGTCSTWINNGTSVGVTLTGLTPNTTYYWQVRAVNPSGTTYANGAKTAFWRFTTLPLPNPPQKRNPENGTTGLPINPMLEWFGSDGATSYEYCYDTSNDNACSKWINVGDTGYIKLSGLKYNTTYYWQVRARNSSGVTNATGNFWSFKTKPLIFTSNSNGTYDGWVLESGENTNVGGSISSTGDLILGDNSANRQYRTILSFNTAALPDTAVVTKVTLKIFKSNKTGINPFATHGLLLADIYKGFFGTATLQTTDFQTAASKPKVGSFSGVLNAPGWYKLELSPANFTYVNKTGTTQFRLYFATDDNNNMIADTVAFYGGEAATSSYRPVLIIEYGQP